MKEEEEKEGDDQDVVKEGDGKDEKGEAVWIQLCENLSSVESLHFSHNIGGGSCLNLFNAFLLFIALCFYLAVVI